MKLIVDVAVNGNVNPKTMAARLRLAADAIESAEQDMEALGSTPPSIEGGNDISFTIPVRGTV